MFASESGKRLRSLDDVIDDLGFGRAQLVFLLHGGGPSLPIGSLKLLLGVLAVIVSDEWSLTPLQRGLLVSAVFAGQGVGNLVFGALSDRYGRRPPLVLCSVVCSIFAILSTFATGFGSMLLWRAALGLSFGLCTSPWNALASEVCPSSSRVVLNGLGSCVFTIGAFYALWLVWLHDPNMQDLDWRLLTVYATLPAVPVFLLGICFLPESPRFLDSRGRRGEAEGVLMHMRRLNGRGDVDVTAWRGTQEAVRCEGFSRVFDRHMRWTTGTMCFSTLVLNYAYYGSFYVLPRLLPGKTLHLSAAGNMMVNSSVECVGLLIGMLLDRCFLRKRALLTYMLGLGFCSLVFFVAVSLCPEVGERARAHHAMPMLFTSLAMYGSNLVVSFGWLYVYVYISEVYPTSCRASASGLCIAFGRAGSVSVPVAVEILSATAGLHAHFAVVSVLLAINAGMTACLPHETKNRQLGEIETDTVTLVTDEGKGAASPAKDQATPRTGASGGGAAQAMLPGGAAGAPAARK